MGGSGPGNYSSIQEAIDDADDGDIVFVYDDSSPYYENIVVYKSISLIGENRTTTIIDASNIGTVVNITANWVNISGFTIRKSGNISYASGIKVYSHNNTIKQNLIVGNRLGIYFGWYANFDNNRVLNNTIKSNTNYGIYATPQPFSYRCKNLTIVGNEITYNGGAGIWMFLCTYSNISYNVLSNNEEGLNMQWQSNNSLIANNIITDNRFYGFWLVYTYRCTVRNNYFENNGWEAICIYQHEEYPEPSNHSIYHNNIIEYGQACYDDGTSWWDDGYPTGGNYYLHYSGEDKYHGPNQNIPGPDGIGDTPYTIPDANNKDYYPLMGPWGKPPLTPLAPDGPEEGENGVEYTFTATTTNPEEEQIWYLFDWGDGTNSSWVGPYNSGEIGSASKIWNEGGDFQVKVKARDVWYRKSNWSDPHIISIIPVPELELGFIRGGLLKVSAPIKNIGIADAPSVEWSISLDGGAFIGKETTGTESISSGGEITVTSKFIFGWGATMVTVTADVHKGVSDKRRLNGFIYLFFIHVNPGGII